MSDVQVYEVVIHGLPHTIQMTAKEAERVGAVPVKAAPEPKNKGRAPRNKKVDDASTGTANGR